MPRLPDDPTMAELEAASSEELKAYNQRSRWREDEKRWEHRASVYAIGGIVIATVVTSVVSSWMVPLLGIMLTAAVAVSIAIMGSMGATQKINPPKNGEDDEIGIAIPLGFAYFIGGSVLAGLLGHAIAIVAREIMQKVGGG